MMWKAKNVVVIILCWTILSMSTAEILQKTRLAHKRLHRRSVHKLVHVPFNKSTFNKKVGGQHVHALSRRLELNIDFDKLEADLQAGDIDALKQLGEEHQELQQQITTIESEAQTCGSESGETPSTNATAPGVEHDFLGFAFHVLDQVDGWVWPVLIILLVGGIGMAGLTFWYIWKHEGFTAAELQGRGSSKLLLLVSFISLLVLWVSSGGCILSTALTLEAAEGELEVLENITGTLINQIDIVLPVVNSSIGNLQTWNSTCAVLVNSFLTKMDIEIEEYLCMAGDISDQLLYVRDTIELFDLLLAEAGLFLSSKEAGPILAITSLPNLLVGLVLIILVTSAVLVGKGHMIWLQKAFETSLKLIGIPLAIMIVVLTVFSVVITFLSASLHQMCRGVDNNLANTISTFLDTMAQTDPDSAGTFEMVKELVVYYITGNGVNPLHEKVGSVTAILGNGMIRTVVKVGWFIVGLVCPHLGEMDAIQLVQTADGLMQTMLRATSRETVHPMYAVVVHDGLCNYVQHNTIFIVLGQAFSIFVSFPLCAYLIHKYISHVIQYEKLHMAPKGEASTQPNGVQYTQAKVTDTKHVH